MAEVPDANPGERGALLARLRAETRDRHETLDLAVGDEMARSRDHYARFLRASFAAVCAVEPEIAPWLGADFRADRAARLKSDLRILDIPATGPIDVPRYVPLSRAAAFGSAYVLEGSGLGGLVLAQRVRASLGDDAPVSYLSPPDATSSSVGVSASWRTFLERLDELGRSVGPNVHAEACRAAVAVFDLYLSAFAQAAARAT